MQLTSQRLWPCATLFRTFPLLTIFTIILMMAMDISCGMMVMNVVNRICYHETQVGLLYDTKDASPVKPVVKVEEQKTGTNCNCASDLLRCDGDQPYFGFKADANFTCRPAEQIACSGLKDENNAEKSRLCVQTEEVGKLVGDTIYPWGAATATGGGCACQEQKLACKAQPFWLDVEDLTTISCIPMEQQCTTLNSSVIMKVCNNGESVGDLLWDPTSIRSTMLVKPVGAPDPDERRGEDCTCSEGNPPACRTPPKLKPRISTSNEAPIPTDNLKCTKVNQQCGSPS